VLAIGAVQGGIINAAALKTETPTARPANWQPLVANDLAFASTEHEVGDATAMPRS
jgi:hypothetical protein